MNGLRKGYVVATHPEDHSVDLVMADDGSRMIGVQVLTPNGSTRSGSIDMPAVPEKANKWDISKITGQDQLAIVGFLGTNPVVLGFLYPQVNQMLFSDPKRKIARHQSDVYKSIDGDGNIELHHPSGLYVRVGETPDHEDLGGKDIDQKFQQDRNTGRSLFVRLETPKGNYQLTINPDGDCLIKMVGRLDTLVDKTILEQAGSIIKNQAPSIVFEGEVFITGDLNVLGATKLLDVSSNGKDISDKHTHKDVKAGTEISGAVVPAGAAPKVPPPLDPPL